MINCRICGKENEGPTYKVREMQLGTEEEFEYFQCSNCECLQIKDFPPSIDKFYPKNGLGELEVNFCAALNL